MRAALPLVLLVFIVAALVIVSRDRAVQPQLDKTRVKVDTSDAVLRETFGASDTRVCISAPQLIEVDGGSGRRISGMAQFPLDEALTNYAGGTGLSVDSLRTITLAVDIDPAQRNDLLVFDMAGITASHAAADQPEATLRFPGHQFRNHSVVSVTVRNDKGALQDLSGYGNWVLCGEPIDDAQFEPRAPVDNEVSDLQLGPGVNVMGGEYACAQGWGLHHHVSAGFSHSDLAEALAAWGVKTVRLPLNEHCWLADTGNIPYLDKKYSGEPYRESVTALVQLLTGQYAMHVLLDLHWTGTTAEQALNLKPLPDNEHSAAFWTDVARRFSGNERVVFNLFNEAHVPASGPHAQSGTEPMDDTVLYDLSANSPLEATAALSNWWRIWRDGNEQFAGMQSLVDAIRATGAANHISVGGLDYSADQRGWLSYAPHDPLGKLWVDNHAYPAGNKCTNALCWAQTLLPLRANGYGIMFGETGNAIGQSPQGCQTDFVKRVYRFARQHEIPVLAWTFIAGGVSDPASNRPSDKNCTIPTLITRWPGESIDEDISQQEVSEKQSFDPTPNDLLDDGTWAGCAFYAYANGLSLDDADLPDIDPAESGNATSYGLCGGR